MYFTSLCPLRAVFNGRMAWHVTLQQFSIKILLYFSLICPFAVCNISSVSAFVAVGSTLRTSEPTHAYNMHYVYYSFCGTGGSVCLIMCVNLFVAL